MNMFYNFNKERSDYINFSNLKNNDRNSKKYLMVSIITLTILLIIIAIILYGLYYSRLNKYKEANKAYDYLIDQYVNEINNHQKDNHYDELAYNNTNQYNTSNDEEANPNSIHLITDNIEVDLYKLIIKNKDCIAWLHYPLEQYNDISYPLMNNKYCNYIDKDFNQKQSISGSIFLDNRNDIDLEDVVSIIYGHSMYDGSMFARLVNIMYEPDTLNNNRYIFLHVLGGYYVYEVFAMSKTVSDSLIYNANISTQEELDDWIKYISENNIYNYDMPSKKSIYEANNITNYNVEDRFLILSTCIDPNPSNRRLAIVAKRVDFVPYPKFNEKY